MRDALRPGALAYRRRVLTWAWMRSWGALAVMDWQRASRLRLQGRASDVARGWARRDLAERKAAYVDRADRLAQLLRGARAPRRAELRAVPARTWLSAIGGAS